MQLSDYMAKHGVNDDAMAGLTGLSRVSVSRIRRGIQRPSWDAMIAFRTATKGAVQPNDFTPDLIAPAPPTERGAA